MPKSLDPRMCADYLKALGDPARLQIVEYLQDGPQTVSVIAAHIGGGVARASHHLQVLLQAGLVASRRDGRLIEYALSSDVLVRGTSTRPNALDFGCCRIEPGPRPQRSQQPAGPQTG